MFQSMIPNQDIPIVPYQDILGVSHPVRDLPYELFSYHISFHFLQIVGGLQCTIGRR